MTLRPYAGGSSHRGASEPRGRGGGRQARDVVPFGADGALSPFGGGLFDGRDPFQEFGGGFGGMGGFGSIMKQFDEMTNNMMRGAGGGMGGGSMMGMGNGQYACQSFAMHSRMGPDGKMHTERYSSSEVGSRQHQIREAQQAYSNSSTGIDKLGLERQLGERARKVVRERDRGTMEERSTEMLRGMDEAGREAFSRDFGAQARRLPVHPHPGAQVNY